MYGITGLGEVVRVTQRNRICQYISLNIGLTSIANTYLPPYRLLVYSSDSIANMYIPPSPSLQALSVQLRQYC